MITKLLIANRGEIASRIIRTARAMDIVTVALYSDADWDATYVAQSDEAVRLPGTVPSDTYLRSDLVVAAAARTGADAVHPGHGFLSENADFATACAQAGVVFVGPRPEAIAAKGSKIAAKEMMRAAGTPIVVLEAMKMEHTVRAPADGVVATISVSGGEQVVTGQVLAIVEADEQ